MEVSTYPALIKDLGIISTNTNKKRLRYGLYKCSCGNEFKAISSRVKNMHTKSCGCYTIMRTKEVNTTHGVNTHPLYNIWHNIIKRTTNIKAKQYKDYGGRGISICERWLKVENFIEDMYPTFEEGLTIDRINNDGNYEPSNCRWTTRSVQSRNTQIIRANNTSGYRGVCFNKSAKKWQAQIVICRKLKYLGLFLNASEAAKAYDSYVIENGLEHTINGG